MKRRFTILTAALALLAFLAIPMGMRGQAPVGTTLWGETWTGGDANETPSAYGFEGTTVYGGATLTYAQSSTNTKLYEEALAGGESPELLLSKSNQTWTISNIPTGQATGMALTFKSNKTTFDVTSTTTGITISGSQKSWTIASTSSVTTFNLTIKNTGSSNARIDDIVLSVTTAGGDTPQPTTYTVTYDANGGSGTMTDSDSPYAAGATVTVLGNEFTRTDYEFDHWNTAADDSGTSYDEDDTFTINANTTLYAQWTENTTPTPSGETATLNIQAYAEANEWVSGTQYATATVAPVTFTANGGGNTGKYYSNGQDWRFYQNESASITISVAEGYTLVSVTPTYSVSNGGVLKNGNATITSGTTVNVSGTSVTFTVGNSGSATNGQVRFTNIDVVYVSNGSTQTTSDLAITNQSTDLTFDLYNNSAAQVISYTTSSTGEITITPATSDYFTYVHDANAKTITVTPTAVTPSEQTVTINQAADENYYSGSASFTVSVANSDPNVPGTANNPYTVAQARAAIDAGTGTQGVYATGIVSSIETAWNTQYSNITFNFVDNAGDTDFLQAYRCVSGTGVDASTVVVGDIVVVHGNLTKYGSTYEFGQGCQLVSLEHPTTPFVTVTPSTINAPFAGAEGTLALIYENIEEFTSFDYYFCDADGNELDVDPDWIQAEIQDENDTYSLYYIIGANNGEARTAYIKVYTTIGDELNPEEVYAIVTVNQAKYVVDYATLPFEFNGGKNAIEETNGLTQSGLGSDYADENTKLKFDGTDDYVILKINERPGTLTFNIKNNSFSGGTFKVQTSEDGVTYTDLKTYTEITGTQDEEFTDLGENVRYIKWIYTEKVSGNVGLGNIALAKYVAPPASITVSNDLVEVDAEEHDGTLDLTYESLTITDMTDFGIQFCDANGDELSEEPDWIEVLVAEQDPEIGEGYVVSYYMVENEDTEARTAYFKVFALGDEDYVYSNLVTISQAAYVAPPTPGNWVLTDLADLTAGDVFVIVGNNGNNYALPNNGGTTSPSVVAVTVVENTLSDEVADNLQWNLSVNNSGYVFYPAGSASTWLYCTNSNDGVRVGTGDAKHFSLSENGYLTTTETNNQRYIGIYNSQDWRCYTSEGGNIANQTFAFYKKVSDPITRSKQIAKYEGDGGYVLIASPVCSVAPSADNGFLTSEYDLYAFDQAEADEWRNYKASSFNLVSGKGYLYASSTATTLTFEGQPYNGNGLIALDYDEDANYAGWNLIGNPFDEAATLNVPFYKMNVDGDGLTAKIEDLSNTIATMEGVFVQATADTRTAIFTVPQNNGDAVEPQTVPQVNIMVSRNRGASVVDNAIVRFDGGSMLGKFQLNANSTKLYMLQGDKEMAIVSAQAEGEMPVSFKAAENGTYTLSVNAENVEMSYLHLFDNMTGADVDLLATPSYTFEANTTDYASRFRLVFSANSINEDADGVNAFAYFNGSSWTVSNMGEATLQVVDVMGRVLSSETLSGNAEVSINQTPGVYMLRLVSGDSVKVQKVVVR